MTFDMKDIYRGAAIEDLQLQSPVSVTIDTTIEQCLHFLDSNDFSNLPVVSNKGKDYNERSIIHTCIVYILNKKPVIHIHALQNNTCYAYTYAYTYTCKYSPYQTVYIFT